jgi:hypothetical protein
VGRHINSHDLLYDPTVAKQDHSAGSTLIN